MTTPLRSAHDSPRTTTFDDRTITLHAVEFLALYQAMTIHLSTLGLP